MNTQPVAPIVAPVIPVMQPMQSMQSIRQPIRQPIINSPAPIPNPVEDETEQQKALLMKVLQLTDDQINALPPQTRDQIRQLVRYYNPKERKRKLTFFIINFFVENSIDHATIINFFYLPYLTCPLFALFSSFA